MKEQNKILNMFGQILLGLGLGLALVSLFLPGDTVQLISNGSVIASATDNVWVATCNISTSGSSTSASLGLGLNVLIPLSFIAALVLVIYNKTILGSCSALFGSFILFICEMNYFSLLKQSTNSYGYKTKAYAEVGFYFVIVAFVLIAASVALFAIEKEKLDKEKAAKKEVEAN